MHQARTEARAEAEAAAEQRVAAALGLERAEFVKQARSLLCMCGTWPCLNLPCRERALVVHVSCSKKISKPVSRKIECVVCMVPYSPHAPSSETGCVNVNIISAPASVQALVSLICACTADPRQCAQVLLARTEALDEVEAAAEQRFAAALAHERAELAKQARSLLCMHGRLLQRPSLVLQSKYATDRERDGCANSACGSMGQGVVELSWRQTCLTITCHALLTERYSPPRCTKRAPRRALRRRRQPSSGWPRWTRRAARRGRLPCARPWRWASGG